MCTAWIVAGCLALAQPAPSPGDVDPALTRRVKRQIAEIQDGATLADRDAAMKGLIDLGPAVLPLLAIPKGVEDPDLTTRLEQVRLALEKQRARQFFQARAVTLPARLPLAQALAELGRQGETRLLDYREQFREAASNPEIALPLADVPFWQALDQLFDVAGLNRYGSPDKPGIAFHNRPDGIRPSAGRAFYSGPFRIEASELAISSNLRRKNPPTVVLNLEVAWEPRLHPIAIYQSTKDAILLDEQGRPLAMERSSTSRELAVGSLDTTAGLQWSFPAPARSVKKIGLLKGSFDVLVPGRVEKFEFANLQAKLPVEREQGEATVTLEQIQKNNAVWEIRIGLEFENAAGALASHFDWGTNHPCTLTTPDGKLLESEKRQLVRRGEHSLAVAYEFAVEDLKGCRLTYAAPVSMVKMPVPYELKDIDLP